MLNLASPPSASLRGRFPRNAFDWAWLLFLIWTAVGFVAMPLNINSWTMRRWFGASWFGHLAAEFMRLSDAIWMLLAAVTTYLHAVRSEGLRTARLQASTILVTSTMIEWVGTRTGFPFGPYEYTSDFGPLIGGVVPAAIPFAWLVIVLCARNVMLWLRPYARRWEQALGVAAIALLTDLNLEDVAWHVRGYWIWYPDGPQNPPPSAWPPIQNYVAWFVLSFAIALVLPSDHTLRIRKPSRWRPMILLLLMNALLAFVHLTGSWRPPPAPPIP